MRLRLSVLCRLLVAAYLVLSLSAAAQPDERIDSEATADGDTDAPELGEVLNDTSQGIVASPDDARGWEERPGTESEDIVLFVPRVILAVPKYVFVAVFWPIRELVEVVERHAIVEHVKAVLYWNDAHTAGWLPIVTFFTNEGFTFGVNVFHNDLFGHDEELSLSARYGGRFLQGYRLRFAGDRVGGTRLWLDSRVAFEINPHLFFAGTGDPDAQRCDLASQAPGATACPTYYRQRRILGLLGFGYTSGQVGDLLKVGATTIVNDRDFGPQERDDRSIETVYDTSQIAGFDDGVTEVELLANLIYDTREPTGLNASGFYMESFGGGSLPIEDFQYWHYGAELAATIDLYRGTRLLTLRVAVEHAVGEREDIPFSELPRLGGANRLRGYDEAQFRDELAGLASVEYHWPIHKSLAGSLFVDAGHVAPGYGDLFDDLSDWRIGGGGGLLFGSEDSVSLRIEFTYGDGFHLFFSTSPAQAFHGRSGLL